MNNLRQQLTYQIKEWQLIYKDRLDEFIYAPLDKRLFSEECETLGFYFAQINQLVDKLQSLPESATQTIEFFCQRITLQCEALNEILIETQSQQSLSREELIKKISQLPPREQLVKYYEGVNELTLRLNELRNELSMSSDPYEQSQLEMQIQKTKERRQRGRNIIDNLECWLIEQSEEIDE